MNTAKVLDRGTVTFRVSSAWLAEFARTRVLEGDWRHGDRILACLCDEASESMRLDLRYGILAGRLTLTGAENEPEITPWEDCPERQEFLRLLHWQWAGLCRVGGVLWL